MENHLKDPVFVRTQSQNLAYIDDDILTMTKLENDQEVKIELGVVNDYNEIYGEMEDLD